MKIKDKILIVEDEQSISNFISMVLNANGYDTIIVGSGEEALTMIASHCPDLIVLDLGLPDMDGMEVLKSVRKWSNLPVVVVSARNHEHDKVEALDYGADDYLVKPFAFEELMARIRCVTRRSPILTPSDPSKVCLEDLTLFIEEKRLMGPAGQCTLSQREAVLTEVLLRAGLNTPMPRTTLLLKVWGPDNDIEDGNLDNYIHFLRRRFRQLESTLQIKTLRGTGYCLTTADERN